MPRTRFGLLLVIAISSSALAAPPASQPECEWAGVERVVAIGDVHGDCGQLVKALRLADLIDQDGNWSGGKAHLVQTGDVLDRGPTSKAAMDLLMKLEGQSAKAGGRVHALIGNHEAMVLLNDWTYLTDEEKESFGGEDGLRKAMSDGLYGKWIRSHNAVIRINDVLFVHAGLTNGAAEHSKTLAEINRVIRTELAKGDEEGLAMSQSGPLWTRALARTASLPDDDGAILLPVLKRFGAARMVVGHTVMENRITWAMGGRLILIDVGMTAYYGGPAACLVIEKGEFFALHDGQKKRKLPIAPIPVPVTSQPDELKPAA